jgi:isoamylase
LLLMHNGSHQRLAFALPAPRLEWNVLADSTAPNAPAHKLEGERLDIDAHGFVLLAAQAPPPDGLTPAA